MIVEAHPLCKMFHELPEFKYIVAKKDSVREIDTKIKKRIGETDKKLANQSVFLFTEKKVVNRGTPLAMQTPVLRSSTPSTRTSRTAWSTSTSPTSTASDGLSYVLQVGLYNKY